MENELKSFEFELDSAARKLREDLTTLRTNRPTTKLVEDIKVDYYGQMLPIKALGSISVNPPREITISVWDKNALGPVGKAIETSGIGITPNVDGSMIRLNLPPLTDERREELTKLVGKMTEEVKIKIRLMRDDINKKTKEAEDKKEISEGEKFKIKDQVQKLVDKTNGEVENLLSGKVKEIKE